MNQQTLNDKFWALLTVVMMDKEFGVKWRKLKNPDKTLFTGVQNLVERCNIIPKSGCKLVRDCDIRTGWVSPKELLRIYGDCSKEQRND